MEGKSCIEAFPKYYDPGAGNFWVWLATIQRPQLSFNLLFRCQNSSPTCKHPLNALQEGLSAHHTRRVLQIFAPSVSEGVQYASNYPVKP